ncbi:MAG: deoxyribose-phosphate aldolase [Bacteroidetes bacterium]|nr:deoxyribose-phosphate aldolase [Bacteroidota bacterium]
MLLYLPLNLIMNDIRKLISAIPSSTATKEELRLILSLIDLSSLEGKDNEKSISILCEKAKKFETAAVCVYPTLVATAKKNLNGTKIKIASVAGAFPSGQLPLNLRIEEVKYAISEGADEIDMVISRGKFLEENFNVVSEEISAFKKTCEGKILKVILETGELESIGNIRKASEIAIDAGADFIKTSTGKTSVNATLESVCAMLLTIKDSGKKVGIKPSGGITDGETAVKYLRLTEKILGSGWLKPELFRFGASRLADSIFTMLHI